MFPIFDRNGNTIAFSGRSLGADEPKYLNSPETAIFNKSKILYNFHLAKPSIQKMQQAVLFEGFADVIAADRVWSGKWYCYNGDILDRRAYSPYYGKVSNL